MLNSREARHEQLFFRSDCVCCRAGRPRRSGRANVSLLSCDISDALRMKYAACLSILGDLEGFGEEALKPPRYHLGDFAQKKLQFIREDLPDCQKLAKN